jgi:immunity protein 50 of polymorphic toxin system
MSEAIKDVAGADELIAWFGQWPSFHDAEVVSVELNRAGISRIRIHYWNRNANISVEGFHKADNHCVVTFLLEQISFLELADFSGQNVISELQIEKQEAGYKLELFPCYGLAGYILAKSIRVEFKPGMPEDRPRP